MLQTVRDVCTLQPEALSFRVSDAVEKIEELIQDEAGSRAFFDRTHITHGMDTLLREGIERLAGKSNTAVFHLKQAMGGGKTHLLLGLGHLARHPDLRKQVCAAAKIPHATEFGSARIAAFNGRDNPDEFFWGALAAQLGKGALFKSFWENGPKAPAESDWLKLLESDAPTLFLLDELPPYFHYLDTQKAGNATAADIATRAFANLLSAAGKRKNVCVVVSDLAASYETGTGLIKRALTDARQELGRQERTITPVDLTGDEIYAILRRRLFISTGTEDVKNEVATHFGRALTEAVKAKVASRSAEAIADEVAATYPFHPRLKNLVALFKDNEKFKQTRGLMELVSLLLKSVWERKTNDVFLIGPQHFDLALPDVRDKLAAIAEMREAIARDLWDTNGAAHAQAIDAGKSDAAAQVGALLYTASMSTAVNAVKGLDREELVETLAMPNRKPSEFLDAFDALASKAWYLHRTADDRHYFDRTENLTKLLHGLAEEAPDHLVQNLIRDSLSKLFKPIKKAIYTEVLPLPDLDAIVERVKRTRVLLIVSPESKLPPEAVQKLFDSITEKNNLCVLTGNQTRFASVEEKARHVFAASKADGRIPKGHAQREELDKKQVQYDGDLHTTILSVFDKVMFPAVSEGRAILRHKTLDLGRDTSKPFNGEDQIERTLVSDPLKMVLDLDAHYELVKDKAENLLWPQGQTSAPWKDLLLRAESQAGFPWLPPKGLEQLRELACNRGAWENLGDGHLSKAPRPKRTGAQIIVDGDPDDRGEVRLRVNPQNAGADARIHYAEDSPVSSTSPLVAGTHLATRALRVSFLVVDPSGKYATGDATTWERPKLTIRNEVQGSGKQRAIKLTVVPRGELRYTLDGSTAREGTRYEGPIVIGAKAQKIWVYAEADGIVGQDDFPFADAGSKQPAIDPAKPAKLEPSKPKKLDAREKVFTALEQARSDGISFGSVQIILGSGSVSVTVTVGDLDVDAAHLQKLIDAATDVLTSTEAVAITMSFKRAQFKSGHALQQFVDKLGLSLGDGEVKQ